MCKYRLNMAGTLATMKKKKEARWYSKAIAIASSRHGWSRANLVKEIARVTDSSESAAYSWLNGNREPTLDVIRRIAKECLGVSIGELIEDDPYFVTDEYERELIDGFRELDKEQQDLFRQLIAAKKQSK
jgi:transcriptional regulator with XRE-family HTH domain